MFCTVGGGAAAVVCAKEKFALAMARRTSAIMYLNFIANRVIDRRRCSKLVDKPCGESYCAELTAELPARLKLNPVDAKLARTAHVCFAVINQKRLGGMHLQTLEAMLIDARTGLDYTDLAGKNMAIELR